MNKQPDLHAKPSHLDWELRLHEWLDGAASPEDAAVMQSHLAGCAICTECVEVLRRLDEELVTEIPADPGLNRAFDEQLFARIAEEEAARAQVRARAHTATPELATLGHVWRAHLLKLAGVVGVLVLVLAWALVSGPLQFISPGSLAVTAATITPLQWIMVGVFGAAVATAMVRWLQT